MFDDLVVYRGHHICTSKTLVDFVGKLFVNQKEEECNKLLDMECFKIKKIKNPYKQVMYLERFKDNIKKLAIKDYNRKQIQRLEEKNLKTD